ncbi:branched-chain amino acid aminotransferase II [Aspergillus insuetus]
MVSRSLRKPATGAPLDASRLKVTLTSAPKPVPAPDSPELASHKVCTDHMIIARWTADRGWADLQLVPYGPLPLMPTASVLHYSTACFEGMKVHRGYDGKLRLFRPEYNCARMLASAIRVSLPDFDPRELHQLIRRLCAVDAPKWLPVDRAGQSLYIRPTLVGSDDSLGFCVPQEALLFVVVSYWPTPPPAADAGQGLRLFGSSEDMVRAWPGGTGSAKISGNYGPSLLAHNEAKGMNYDQVLWLFGPEGYVTEAGSSNFFAIWRTSDEGKLQLVTAPLADHTILAGVTRQSILDLARERLAPGSSYTSDSNLEPLEVVEGKFTIFDLIKAARDGRLLGAFAVGTACFVVPVARIHYKDQDIDVPGDAVPHVSALRKWMSDVLFGNEENGWGDVIIE